MTAARSGKAADVTCSVEPGRRLELDGHPEPDGHRQCDAEVVVGVVADQVDPTGADAWRAGGMGRSLLPSTAVGSRTSAGGADREIAVADRRGAVLDENPETGAVRLDDRGLHRSDRRRSRCPDEGARIDGTTTGHVGVVGDGVLAEGERPAVVDPTSGTECCVAGDRAARDNGDASVEDPSTVGREELPATWLPLRIIWWPAEVCLEEVVDPSTLATVRP